MRPCQVSPRQGRPEPGGKGEGPPSLARIPTATLWRLREQGDTGAREELVRRYLSLARALASRYMSRNEPLEDLIQVASLGLLHAIDRYDTDRGTSFAGFAVPTILGELKRHFRDTGWSVHVPRRAKELALQVEQASRKMTDQAGRAPSVRELAEHLKIGIEAVVDGLEVANAHYSISIDAPAYDAGPQTALVEVLGGTDERFGLIDGRLTLAAGVRELPYQEREAVTLRITEGLNQTQIARRLGCSQMQVSRLLKRAAGRLTRLADPPLAGTLSR
jgi:RNA polymerase sigma-B factor